MQKDSLQQPLRAKMSHEEAKEFVLKAYRKNAKTKYPVAIDDVWAICYATKGSAVRALKRDYVEGTDYMVNQNTTDEKGRNEVTYYLSLECFEYFIVRMDRVMFYAMSEILHELSKHVDVDTQAEILNKSIEQVVSDSL